MRAGRTLPWIVETTQPARADQPIGRPTERPELRREAARHLAQRTHRLLCRGGALVAALSLVLPLAMWRLTQGPIELDFLAPYVGGALDRAGIGVGVRLSGLRFGIDRSTHALDLRADNVRLAAPDGAPLASLPETAISVPLGPLLEGRLAPSTLVVEHPVLHLRRDADGAVSINLAPGDRAPSGAGATSAAPVALDRLLSPTAGDSAALPRRIAISGATVLLDDAGTGRTWRAEPVDLSIERGSDGVRGEVSLALPLAASRPELHGSFRYAADSRRLDLDLSLDGALPADIAALAPGLAPLRQVEAAISGKLRTGIDLAGSTVETTRLDVAIGGGRLRDELLPNGGVAIAGGELHAVYAPPDHALRLDALRLDLGGGSEVAVSGAVPGLTPELIAAAVAGRPIAPLRADVTAALRHIPAARLGGLWPAAFSPGGRRWVLANVHDGVLDEASVQLALALDPAARTANVANAAGTLRYHDLTIGYLKGLEPVRKASGRAVFSGDRLEFTPTGGRLRGLNVTGGSLRLTELGHKIEWLTVDLAVAGPLRDVLQVIDAEPLFYAHDIGVDPVKVAGNVETQLHFRLPMLDALKLAQVEYGVRARLAGVGIADAALGHDLSGGDFTLAIDRPGARLSGAARFADIPARLEAELLFHAKGGPRARYRVMASLDDAARRRLGLDIAGQRVSGPVALDAGYTEFVGKDGGGKRGEADIRLDLRDAALAVPEAGWTKKPGEGGTARIVLDIDNDRISRLRRVDAQAPGLHAVLSGRFAAAGLPDGPAQSDADGNRIAQIDIHRLTLGGNDLAGTVARRAAGGWRADIHAATLDAQHLLKDAKDPAPAISDAPDHLPPLAVKARIGRLLLGPHRELHNIAASLLRDGGDWRSAAIDARDRDGGGLWLRLAEDGEGQRVMFRSDDLGAVLRLFDVTDSVSGGRLRIEGHLSREAGMRILRAHVEGEDYTVRNSSTALRVLSLPSLTGMASAVSGSGLPFSTLRGDVVYRDGVLSIEKALAYGESIGITTTGWVDTGRDRLRLNGTIAPAYAVNSLLGKVPVVGAAFGGAQGLFAADFRLSGATSDPDVAVNPLSVVTPGGLRDLLAPLVGFPKPQPEGKDGQ